MLFLRWSGGLNRIGNHDRSMTSGITGGRARHETNVADHSAGIGSCDVEPGDFQGRGTAARTRSIDGSGAVGSPADAVALSEATAHLRQSGTAASHRRMVVRCTDSDSPPARSVLSKLGYADPGMSGGSAPGTARAGHPAKRHSHLLDSPWARGGAHHQRAFHDWTCGWGCGAQSVRRYSAPSDSSLMISAADWIELTAPTDSPA
jgi:hypothetical protein